MLIFKFYCKDNEVNSSLAYAVNKIQIIIFYCLLVEYIYNLKPEVIIKYKKGKIN